MVLDSWEGVSGVPGLGVSIPRSRSLYHPLQKWHNNHKEMYKNKLKVGSSSKQHTQKHDLGKISVQLPRVMSTRSSSFSSSSGNSQADNSSSLVKYSNVGFSMPPPLPRVQASSSTNSVRKSGGKQWRHLTGYNQRYQANQQRMEKHPVYGDESSQSHNTSAQSSHQHRPLSKSKSLRINSQQRWSFHDRFSLVDSDNSGPASLPLNVDSGSTPLDCNYYPCSSCNCCCDRHKETKKRVMFRDASPSIISQHLPSSPSIISSYSLPGRKGVVGVKEHLRGKQHRGSFESSEGGCEDEFDVGSHKEDELYYSRPPDESDWYSSSLISQSASHVTQKYPNLGIHDIPSDHYQSPREVDGDYAYAYSDCISPAFLIRAESYNNYDENIYEEINVGSNKVQGDGGDDLNSGKMQGDVDSPGSSSSSSKINLKQVIEKIRRKCSVMLDTDNTTGKVEAVSKRSSDGSVQDTEGKAMFGELEEVNRVMSKLHLDVKDLLQPLPCSIYPRRPQDSGFNSGGMSQNSSSPTSSKKSLVSRTPSYEEVESIDFANQQPNPSRNSLRVSLVDMDHTLEDLDHIVSVLKGDMNHHL